MMQRTCILCRFLIVLTRTILGFWPQTLEHYRKSTHTNSIKIKIVFSVFEGHGIPALVVR